MDLTTDAQNGDMKIVACKTNAEVPLRLVCYQKMSVYLVSQLCGQTQEGSASEFVTMAKPFGCLKVGWMVDGGLIVEVFGCDQCKSLEISVLARLGTPWHSYNMKMELV